MSETIHLRWFNPHGTCRQCSKKSDGVLMGSSNESYGEHCKKCADKRLKASKKQRELDIEGDF